MNRENVAKWADELQFGGHRKARGFFHTPNFFQGGQFGSCAMGVADLIRPREGLEPQGVAFNLTVEWLGISRGQVMDIVSMNDHDNKPLPEIGAWIRDNWLKEE